MELDQSRAPLIAAVATRSSNEPELAPRQELLQFNQRGAGIAMRLQRGEAALHPALEGLFATLGETVEHPIAAGQNTIFRVLHSAEI